MATASKKRLEAPIPPKLQAVLTRLIGQAPAPLTITQAVKLPYLVDVLAHQVLGRSITEGRHETWSHGVVTSEAWHHLHSLPPGAAFRVTPVPYSEEIRVEAADEAAEAMLSADEQRIVDFVADEYAFVPATELGALTKRMNPSIRGWGMNHPADTGGDAYERMTPEYIEMSEAVSGITLDQLRRGSHPISKPEDVIA